MCDFIFFFRVHRSLKRNKENKMAAQWMAVGFVCQLMQVLLYKWHFMGVAFGYLPRGWQQFLGVFRLSRFSEGGSQRVGQGNGYLPFRTCTRTLATSALEGAQEYLPESARSAFCMSRNEVVTSPFSVITDTPPLDES